MVILIFHLEKQKPVNKNLITNKTENNRTVQTK